MTLVQELERFDATPAYAATLKQFKLPAIANKVGISPGYLSNILTGYKLPSKALSQKLQKLADTIEASTRRQ